MVHGNIPDSWIAAQIARLNAGYDAAGFTFALIRVCCVCILMYMGKTWRASVVGPFSTSCTPAAQLD